MSRRVRRYGVYVAMLSLCPILSCNVQGGLGSGGGFISFEVGGQTFTLTFGSVGRIEATAGETVRVPTSRGSAFPDMPTDQPASATMRLPSDSFGTFGRGVTKAIARSQALPLSGSVTVRFLVASGSSTDPCGEGVLLAEYDVSFTTGVTAVLNEVFEISSDALAIVLTNDVTFCIEISTDFDADFTIGDIEITFGGGTGTGTGAGTFNLFNVDTVENIHILLPGEDFDASNRLTPGSDRTATLTGLEIGDTVELRAGRNGTVLDTTTCPAVAGGNYEATATWDGETVMCTATSSGDDGGVPPGEIIQIPIDNLDGSAVVAPVTTTIDGVDYGVVGVLENQTAGVTAGGNPLIDPSPLILDLTELGLETVETIYTATHTSFAPNLPAGVTMATLTVSYAEGGTPTTLDLVTGENTAEWSYDRPEHVTEFGGVAHPQPPILYSFPTTISSSSEYTAYEYAVSLSLDTSRTPACLSLTMTDPATYSGLRVGDTVTVPGADWGEQALMAVTLEGPAGTPSVIGDCSGTPISGDDGFCNQQSDCEDDEICTPDSVCIPGFGTNGIFGEDCSDNDLCNANCVDTDPDCAFCGDDEPNVCMEGCPGVDPDCTCANCPGECFDNICFVQGEISYADAVITYDPTFGGNEGPSGEDTQTPEDALGAPDYDNTTATHVTLGQGGLLELAFTDNVLTNSGDSQFDLRVFEVGPDVEATFVAVRATGETAGSLAAAGISPDGEWFEVGRIEGSTRNVDIDAAFPSFGPGDLRFDAVRLIDDKDQGGGGGTTPGADIDAVGAIATLPAS